MCYSQFTTLFADRNQTFANLILKYFQKTELSFANVVCRFQISHLLTRRRPKHLMRNKERWEKFTVIFYVFLIEKYGFFVIFFR